MFNYQNMIYLHVTQTYNIYDIFSNIIILKTIKKKKKVLQTLKIEIYYYKNNNFCLVCGNYQPRELFMHLDYDSIIKGGIYHKISNKILPSLSCVCASVCTILRLEREIFIEAAFQVALQSSFQINKATHTCVFVNDICRQFNKHSNMVESIKNNKISKNIKNPYFGQCCICYNLHHLVIAKCNHSFCKKCTVRWINVCILQTTVPCPICRTELSFSEPLY
jgi:hypothetical protein